MVNFLIGVTYWNYIFQYIHTKLLFVCGAVLVVVVVSTLDGIWGLLLSLCLEMIPGRFGGPYGMFGIKSKLVIYKSST